MSDDADLTHLFDMLTPQKNGKRTEPVDLIFSAHLGAYAEAFPSILKLHVRDGARIADVTYGKGGLWKFVAKGRYETLFSDLNSGSGKADARIRKYDCRKLPYDDDSCEALVLDPPSTIAIETEVQADHDTLIGFYVEAAREANRVLKKKGALIVRCQDEGGDRRQRLTHVEVINEYEKLGFYCDDLFVVVSNNLPTVGRFVKQRRARKIHGYVLVFRAR